MLLRPLAVVLAFLAFAPVATAASAPADLRGFLLRANDPQPAGHAFPRTPAFAWDNVKGASSYEFQLATSKNFSENSIVWEKADLPNPITSVPLTLPWITGNPYSLYARVRANVGGDATSWSTKYGFKMKAPAAPTSLSNGANPTPGMVRWTPVEGATAYEVSFLWDVANGQNKKIKTSTTAADLRELYAFANNFGAPDECVLACPRDARARGQASERASRSSRTARGARPTSRSSRRRSRRRRSIFRSRSHAAARRTSST